ncbi:MAG: hypothetical protein KBD35_06810 [Moraxellaceae bacterium]|jgi:uncharacterized protein|nr:hypothetical protein [Moraxellaceae bacterium]MBP7229064.1 hypothetical protein [Moraxellaceae bacterium]MBP9045401.1 hypothetical protein [Moraxellaceae bacterium]MBP9731100.1 hypothetical protein [Moraxellaceae bacterium]HQX89170.1 PP0621 family protein [Moraxellaceae bacterium]
MGVILRLAIIGFIIWTAWRFLQRYLVTKQSDQVSSSSPPPSSSQAMRRCAYCNVHIPEGESTQSRGEFFCCEAHRDAHLRERR